MPKRIDQLTPWKPGQSGNPGGRPKELLTTQSVAGLMGRLCRLTRDELFDVVKDPKSTMIEIMVASIMARAADQGDAGRLDFLLNRAIGRVKERLEVDDIRKELEAMSKDELISRLEADLMRLKNPVSK